jgi:WhiB family transcriptional regulator, redox-sensing transcriptional regulator
MDEPGDPGRLVDGETDWMADGNCAHRNPSMFFPSDGVGVEVARRICADCPVKEPCLEYALAHRIDHGVWGGCSERERRRILKRRRQEAAATEAAAQSPTTSRSGA